MSKISQDRERAVLELGTSLGQTGGPDVFTAQSARNLMLAVSQLETKIKKWAGPSQLETKIKKWAGPSAFPDDGRINEQQLHKTVKKPDNGVTCFGHGRRASSYLPAR